MTKVKKSGPTPDTQVPSHNARFRTRGENDVDF
jgi:hypothetical protein